jgi:hypothetical protein
VDADEGSDIIEPKDVGWMRIHLFEGLFLFHVCFIKLLLNIL